MDNQFSKSAFTELNDRIIGLLDSFSALSTLSSLDIRRLDADAMLKEALMGLMENMDMERCSIFLLEDDVLVNRGGLDWEDILARESKECRPRPFFFMNASIGEGIMGLAVVTKSLQHCRDCAADARFMSYPGYPIGSLISVPIFQLGGEVLGVLNVSHPLPNFFNEWHERLLMVYCNCLGQLIVNHRLLSHMDVEVEKRTGQLVRALEEARAAEKVLREREEQLNLVLEGSNDGFWDWSPASREARLSPRWAGILGYTITEVEELFRQGRLLIHPDDATDVMKHLAEHLEGRVCQYSIEYRMRARSGEWKWILDRGKVVERDLEGRPLRMAGTMTDVTDRRRAEEDKTQLETQLHHSQKMEAIGQLAGGVAHEFNNIMTAIIGYGHLLVMKTDENSQLRHFASQILTSAERASGLTRSLLTFSRKQITNPHHVVVNETIEKIGKLLSRLIREDIEFRTELSEERLTVLADDGQIEQVLMNLVTNARDAMPGGGALIISTGIATLGEDTVKPRGKGTVGEYARISVTDTGIGMDGKTREKIFEPFFTTKEPGKGTGLGMAIVYGIVREQGGHIGVLSNPGAGTTVSVYLPLIREEGTERGVPPRPALKTGTGTLLIAEDDDDVRRLDRELFEECGYTVIEAANGREALDLFLEHRDAIDLVMFDVIMPKMNGREVFEEIRKIRSDVKVLFTSGYTGDILNGKGDMGKDFDFVAKPIPPGDLLAKVREVLDRPHAC